MPDRLHFVARRSAWDNVLESQFVSDILLGDLGRPVTCTLIDHDAQFPLHDDLLVLNHENSCTDLIRQALAAGCRNVGVVSWAHTGNDDVSYYSQVDYVIRPYFRSDIFSFPAHSRCAAVVWVPNGYRSGVGPRNPQSLPTFHNRTFEMFFAGCPKTNPGERDPMIAMVRDHHLPAQMILTDQFAQGLSIHTYRSYMENTRFALIPGGADAETIRLFEALELGTIPVCINHPFLADDRAMAGAPVIRLSNWNQWPAYYAHLCLAGNYENVMEQYRSKVGAWWQDFKRQKQAEIRHLIDASFADTALPQSVASRL